MFFNMVGHALGSCMELGHTANYHLGNICLFPSIVGYAHSHVQRRFSILFIMLGQELEPSGWLPHCTPR